MDHGDRGLNPLWVCRLGLVDYDAAVRIQEQVQGLRQERRIPDTLLLLQHPPVVTLGRGARAEHLLTGEEELTTLGVQLRTAGRGGDVTCHAPGQIVGYPILHLEEHGRDVHRYLRLLEEALIRTLARYGVQAGRIPGLTGVWAGDEKIAAIGVGVRRWVTWHGFALNVCPDLSIFEHVVPCGIRSRGVTSFERLVPACPPVPAVEEQLAVELGGVFGLEPVEMDLERAVAAGNARGELK